MISQSGMQQPPQSLWTNLLFGKIFTQCPLVAEPGFPRAACTNLQRGVRQPVFLAKSLMKWDREGALAPFLDPPLPIQGQVYDLETSPGQVSLGQGVGGRQGGVDVDDFVPGLVQKGEMAQAARNDTPV